MRQVAIYIELPAEWSVSRGVPGSINATLKVVSRALMCRSVCFVEQLNLPFDIRLAAVLDAHTPAVMPVIMSTENEICRARSQAPLYCDAQRATVARRRR